MLLRALLSLSLLLSSLGHAKSIPLEKPEDFVRMTSEISHQSASQFIADLTVAASRSSTVTVFIDSPGGDVLAGIRILDAVAGLRAVKPDLRLVCYTHFAASMAFFFVQIACDHRIVSQYSVLMQHQASLGMAGKWGEVQSRSELVRQIVDLIETKAATRLRLTVPEYRAKVVNDWWLVGVTAVKERAADFIGSASCSPELVAAGQCPLVYVPLSSADGRSRGQSAPGEGQTSNPQPKR